MTCAHCVRAVFTALGGVEGVSRADVSIGKAVIDHDGSVGNDAIREAISIAGYDVADFRDDVQNYLGPAEAQKSVVA